MSGYHKREINKGVIGELSKVYEEVEEVKDAEDQQNTLMVLIELADVIGAIGMYLEKQHPSISIDDLLKMSKLTNDVFKRGYRQ